MVVGAAVLVGPRQIHDRLPWVAPSTCPATIVQVTASPDIAPVVTRLLDPLQGTELPGGTCLQPSVRAQASRDVVERATMLPVDSAPAVWVADSSLWGGEVQSWKLATAIPSMARSAVVVATSSSAAAQLGWNRAPPSWQDAMRGSRPFAVQDLRSQTGALQSLIALWQTMGRNAAADSAVVGTVLSADRTEIARPEQALAVARSGSVNAPLLPATEQQIAASNTADPASKLIAVYPRDGSPVLDYPVYTTSAGSTGAAPSPAVTRAVSLIVDRLRPAAAGPAVRAAGFRDAGGRPGTGLGVAAGALRELRPPTPAEVDGMLKRIDQLGRPSKLLLLLDVSESMRERLSDGVTKAVLAEGAIRLGESQLPDRSAAGVWIYSSRIGPTGADWRVLSAPAGLGVIEKNGETHRQHLLDIAHLQPYLRGDRRATYNALLWAARYMRRHYDPRAVSAIILMTDGRNNVDYGVRLPALLAELRAAASADERVTIYIAALGPTTDFGVLRQIANTSGGHAYQIDTADQGQAALLDGLRRSRHIGR